MDGSFAGFGWFLHRQALIITLLFSASLWTSCFMHISLLWYSALGHLCTFNSSDAQLCLLNAGDLLSSLVFSLPVPKPGISLKGINYSNNRAYLIGFLSLRNHCTLLLDFYCLENFFYFFICCLFFAYLVLKGKSCPCFFILTRSRSPLFVLFCFCQCNKKKKKVISWEWEGEDKFEFSQEK